MPNSEIQTLIKLLRRQSDHSINWQIAALSIPFSMLEVSICQTRPPNGTAGQAVGTNAFGK